MGGQVSRVATVEAPIRKALLTSVDHALAEIDPNIGSGLPCQKWGRTSGTDADIEHVLTKDLCLISPQQLCLGWGQSGRRGILRDVCRPLKNGLVGADIRRGDFHRLALNTVEICPVHCRKSCKLNTSRPTTPRVYMK